MAEYRTIHLTGSYAMDYDRDKLAHHRELVRAVTAAVLTAGLIANNEDVPQTPAAVATFIRRMVDAIEQETEPQEVPPDAST